MSLINQMLQDLDRDEAGEGNAKPMPAGLSAEQKTRPASPRRFVLPALAASALVYALLVEWNLLGLMPEKKSAAVEIPKPIALNSKWLAEAPQTAKTSAIGIETPVSVQAVGQDATDNSAAAEKEISTRDTANSVQDSTGPVQDSAGAVQNTTSPAMNPSTDVAMPNAGRAPESNMGAVEQLLQAAANAFAADRLTTPAGENAYQLYKSVLVIDPQNSVAMSGIDGIKQRYIEWFENAIANNRHEAAREYLRKAQMVGLSSTQLDVYQQQLANHDQEFANVEQRLAGAGLADLPPATSAVEEMVQARIVPARAAGDAEMAERLRKEGLRAEREALSFLVQAPDVQQTAVVLADLYMQQGAMADSRHLADVLAKHAHPVNAYVNAQVDMLGGRDQRAIETLSAIEFSGFAELQRLRLLAGLQQKNGNFTAAMDLYSALVSLSVNNAGDWLGLAVSADRNRLTGTALNAYEKVLLLNHPDPRVMQFARQRQQDLSLAVTQNR